MIKEVLGIYLSISIILSMVLIIPTMDESLNILEFLFTILLSPFIMICVIIEIIKEEITSILKKKRGTKNEK